jgi:nicotinate-nucleotide adenylyltransferase
VADFCGRFDDLGEDGTPAKLGVMGGTFDPIHIGHLACAERVRDVYGLDGVVFMPSGDPWMKRGRGITSAEHRYQMTQRAVAADEHFDVSRLEVDRPGATYTVDTLRQLRQHFPDNVELYFIFGADTLYSILQWRDVDEVARLAYLISVARPGYAADEGLVASIRVQLGSERIDQIEGVALDVSSTRLRQMVREGRSIRYLVPDAVVDYIAEQGLYRDAEPDDEASSVEASGTEARKAETLGAEATAAETPSAEKPKAETPDSEASDTERHHGA